MRPKHILEKNTAVCRCFCFIWCSVCTAGKGSGTAAPDMFSFIRDVTEMSIFWIEKNENETVALNIEPNHTFWLSLHR